MTLGGVGHCTMLISEHQPSSDMWMKLALSLVYGYTIFNVVYYTTCGVMI